MSDDIRSDHPIEQERHPEPLTSPGHRLREARIARGIDQLQIADQLNLSSSQVDALERDDWEALPGAVFIFGYLRGYARLVGLDPESLIRAFRQQQPDVTGAAPRAATTSPSIKDPSRVPFWISMAVLALVLVLGLQFLLTHLGLTTGSSEPLVTETETADRLADRDILSETTAPETAQTRRPSDPLISSTNDAMDGPWNPSPLYVQDGSAQTAGPDPLPADSTEDSTAVSSISAVPTDADQPAVPASADATPVPMDAVGPDDDASDSSATLAGDENSIQTIDPVATDLAASDPIQAQDNGVRLLFTDECWVDIRDGSMKSVLNGVMKSGDRHQLDGPPPYSMVLGKASAVELTIGDRLFDLAPYTRGNVARLTLTADDLNTGSETRPNGD